MNYMYIEKSEYIHPNPNTFDFPQRQYFTLPRDLISHINLNPCSALGFQKLQKTCKYFFAKNKIVFIDEVVFQDEKNFIFHRIYKDNKPYYDQKFNGIFKYWLTSTIRFYGPFSIFQNIFRCSIKTLFFENINVTQFLTLNEFNFLVYGQKLVGLYLHNVVIVNDGDKKGTMVTLDQILEKVSNLQNLRYESKHQIFTSETFEKMNSLKFKSKIIFVYLKIHNVAPNTDISLLSNFIKNNASEDGRCQFSFQFKMKNSEPHLAILRTAIKKMFQKWSVRKTPYISIS